MSFGTARFRDECNGTPRCTFNRFVRAMKSDECLPEVLEQCNEAETVWNQFMKFDWCYGMVKMLINLQMDD